MPNKEAIVACIAEPIEKYCDKMVANIGDWKHLIEASQRVLAGETVREEEYPPYLWPNISLQQLIMEVTQKSEWNWSSPRIQEAFAKITNSEVYRAFAETSVEIVTAIVRTVPIGSIVEVGTGPGQVTRQLCQKLQRERQNIPLLISDQAPGIKMVAEQLRNDYPELTIRDFVWNLKETPPASLLRKLRRPVLLFERFCIPYAGYEAIQNISAVPDIFLMVEDLNLTGKRQPYDKVFEKIGLQFFPFEETIRQLKMHFSFIHTCDHMIPERLGAPVSDFTLAIK